MTWSSRTVLVTGATGLVGASLVSALLAKGAQVVALVRNADPLRALNRHTGLERVRVITGCLEELSDVERAVVDWEVDTVFHLGAQTQVQTAWRNPLGTFEANVRGTAHVLEVCRRHSSLVRALVVASSDKAYGPLRDGAYREEAPLCGKHPYDVSKSCADLLTSAYHASYGLPAAIARCGNIYGPGDVNFQRLIPSTLRSLLRGERPVLRSDGTHRRDYVYVSDVAEVYMKLAEALWAGQAAGRAYNFGPGRSHSVLEVVSELQSLLGAEALEPIILNRAVGEHQEQHLDASRLQNELGISPTVMLREGLERSIPWYRRYLEERADEQ